MRARPRSRGSTAISLDAVARPRRDETGEERKALIVAEKKPLDDRRRRRRRRRRDNKVVFFIPEELPQIDGALLVFCTKKVEGVTT